MGSQPKSRFRQATPKVWDQTQTRPEPIDLEILKQLLFDHPQEQHAHRLFPKDFKANRDEPEFDSAGKQPLWPEGQQFQICQLFLGQTMI